MDMAWGGGSRRSNHDVHKSLAPLDKALPDYTYR